MTPNNPPRRPALAAAVAAGLLLFTFGLSYRTLAARLAVPVSNTPIGPTVVTRFPMNFRGWTGEDVPLDEMIVRATGSDCHINRRYSHPDHSGSVLLYVAAGVNVRAVMSHHPEGCYPNVGWTLVDRSLMELQVADGTTLPCTMSEFRRGTVDTETVTVLHYSVAGKSFHNNVSSLRRNVWHLFSMVGYVGQVQIVLYSHNFGADSTRALATTFAIDSAPAVATLFTDIGEARESAQMPRH